MADRPTKARLTELLRQARYELKVHRSCEDQMSPSERPGHDAWEVKHREYIAVLLLALKGQAR